MKRALKIVIFLCILAMLIAPVATAMESEIDSSTPSEGDTSPADGHMTLSINDGQLVEEEKDGKIVVDLGTDFRVLSFAWDPTGEYVLIVGEMGIIVKLTIDGTVSYLPSGTTDDLLLVSWKPVALMTGEGSDSFALIVGQGCLLKWDGTQVIHIMEDYEYDLDDLEWSEDGEYAIIKGKDGKVFRYPPEVDTTPFISISKPLDGEVVEETIMVKGVAKDPDGPVVRVEVRFDDDDWTVVDGTSKWTYEMDISEIPNGIHRISARAYDGTIFSAPATLDVDVRNNMPPTVLIDAPITGSVVPTKFLVQGTASDLENGLESIWVKVDNGLWFLADGLEEWTFEVDMVPFELGTHTIMVKAYDGRVDSEIDCIIIDVRNVIYDPEVLIESPGAGKEYMTSQDILLSASADYFGPSDLIFVWESNIDGEIGTGNDITTRLTVGNHKIWVMVTDGILEETAEVSIKVIDDTYMAPKIHFIAPTEGRTIRGEIDIVGVDAHGVMTAVQFSIDGVIEKTMSSGTVWKYTWDTAKVTDGAHYLTAKAYDGKSWSDPVSIKVVVDNGQKDSVGPGLRPDTPIKDTGTPTTGGLDERTATAIAATSFIMVLFMLIGVVESYKVKFLGLTFVPLYSRIKKEKVLDNFTRGAIYGFIVANPGSHYNLIKQELKLNNGAIIYHLDILERKGFINSEKAGIYKRYYQKGHKQEGGILDKLTDIQKRIFIEIKGTPGVSQKEIANKLNITARALNYHIKTMLKAQLIKLERVGRRTLCFIDGAFSKKDTPVASV